MVHVLVFIWFRVSDLELIPLFIVYKHRQQKALGNKLPGGKYNGTVCAIASYLGTPHTDIFDY